MTYWTFDRMMLAHFGKGYALVPDQIAENQKQHDAAKTVFPVYPCDMTGRRTHFGRPILARLDGNAYGLYTAGTGDMVVQRVPRTMHIKRPQRKFSLPERENAE